MVKANNMNDSSLDAVIMVDDTDTVTSWNPAAERMFGYTAPEAVGSKLHKMIIPRRYQERHLKAFGRYAATGMGSSIGHKLELTACKKSGEEFSVELSLSGRKSGGKYIAIGVIRDISERERLRV